MYRYSTVAILGYPTYYHIEVQILSIFGLNKTKHSNSLDISTLTEVL